MDKKQKLQYQQEVEKYLEEKKVYDILEDLMKQLIVQQPDNPIDYMIKKLSDKEQKKIFIVGPPGSKIKEVALQLSYHLQFECVSVGDLLKKEISKKSEIGQKIENQVKQFQYVEDKIVIDLVKKTIEEYDKDKKSYILEGFPKTRVQGLHLQKNGVIPDTFIIYHMPDDKISQGCLAKISNGDGLYSHIAKFKKEHLAQNHTIEYTLNIKQVKEIYDQNYFSIDANNVQQGVLEDIVKLVSFKVQNKSPKRAARIIILGPPGSGRSTLAKKLAQKYGLIYVSTQELLNSEVAKKTQVGQTILPLIQAGEQVMDDVIFSLLNDRINQTDCHLQGFVLDGFPKNSVQLMHLDELKITPSLLIILECADETIEARLSNRKLDPITGTVYDRMNPCQDLNVQRRLEKIMTDTPEILQQRTKRWKDLIRTLETTYQTYLPLILKVNAEQSAQNILEEVSLHLEKKVRENIEIKNF